MQGLTVLQAKANGRLYRIKVSSSEAVLFFQTNKDSLLAFS
jgi:hypothetical protein